MEVSRHVNDPVDAEAWLRHRQHLEVAPTWRRRRCFDLGGGWAALSLFKGWSVIHSLL